MPVPVTPSCTADIGKPPPQWARLQWSRRCRLYGLRDNGPPCVLEGRRGHKRTHLLTEQALRPWDRGCGCRRSWLPCVRARAGETGTRRERYSDVNDSKLARPFPWMLKRPRARGVCVFSGRLPLRRLAGPSPL
ncbi:hypothetical protein HJG60_009419 [Phyllostomus discolor]|uniref:Uncharacterized protein n=1 Tax=Phyllostomus discolor TaxID=89673 RepID=A0A833Y905_9CHIR|nr:hypothetical protein HJG60_009419 [Phyllostomus discolor]